MIMLMAPLATFAQKFGKVNTQTIMQSLPEISKINGELEATAKQYENDLKSMQEELQRQSEAYDKGKSTMNATAQQQKEQELQQLYPGFNLQQELQNETFARLTGPNSGISVKQAYYAVHKDEIEAAQAAAIAQRTALDMSRSIQSGSSRPQENGLGSSNPVSLSDNPANWSAQRRKEIAARAKAGESISF